MKPPRAAKRLLDLALPHDAERDTIRGDLLEEYGVKATRSRWRAALWYWRAVLSVVLWYRRPGASHHIDRPHARDALSQDVRYAARRLRQTPGYTGVVLATLALGIGANTAIFSALHAVLLEPLPYPNAARLVRLVAFNPSMGIASSNVSAADFTDWRRDAHSFDQLAAFATFNTSIRGMTDRDPAERIAGVQEFNLLPVLGASPAIGRDFRPDDARKGVASVAIVSAGFWKRRFGGEADAIGRPLRSGAPTVIVGVVPETLSYPSDVDLWVPALLDPNTDPRNNRYYEALGLLKAGVTVYQAQAELDAIAARLETAFPETNRGWRVRAVPLLDYVVKDSRRTLLLLFGAVVLVMLIACANVANLSVAHAFARQREIAVRAAIGATRMRIVDEVLTESVLLSIAAGGLGITIGYWMLQLLIAIGGGEIPRLEHARLDPAVLLFSFVLSVATGVLFGLLPAVQLSRPTLLHALREGTAGAGSRGRARAILITGEVALAVVLLVAAGLLGRSFDGVQRIDVGFQPANLLTMRVTLTGPKYRQPGSDVAFFTEAIRLIEALPDVRSAGAMLSLPVGGGGFYLGRGFIRPGRAHPPEGYSAGYQIVTPRSFAALRVPLLRGRDFDARDSSTSPPVAIINRTLADRVFAGENPIGQQVLVWYDEKTPREIVGVVGDLKSADLTATAGAEIYVPNTQSWSGDLTLLARTSGPAAAAAPAIRAALQSLDPTQAVYDVRTMESVMHEALAQQRFSLALFGGFAAVSLVLVAVGLYGLMTNAVAAREREIGIRLALGARPSEVRRLVVIEGLTLFVIGLSIGMPCALVAARLLGTLLYGVSPNDPATALAVISVIALVTCLAAYVPARRSTRVDPAAVLRGS